MARRRMKKRASDSDLKTARDRIKHVVVLMLENRSFDHLFGFLDHPNPEFPRLLSGAFLNPLDPSDPRSQTVGVSNDAGEILELDPPHSHVAAKQQMNGVRWRRLRMNGFVGAYRLKLAGKEHLPFIHWGRIAAFVVTICAGFAVASASLKSRAELSDWSGLIFWTLVGVFVALALVASNLVALTRRPWWQLVVAGLVVAGLLAFVGDGIARCSAHKCKGFEFWWLAFSEVGIAIVWRQRGSFVRKRLSSLTQHELVQRSKKIMRCMSADRIPVLAALARGYAVCTRWHSSVPGATWPNRNFLHAATSDGTVDIEIGFYNDRTIFDLLDSEKKDWRIYHDHTAQLMAFDGLWAGDRLEKHWFDMDRFAVDASSGKLPQYAFIEPRHDGVDSNSQHPGNNMLPTHGGSDFARGEELVRSIYEALAASPVFNSTLFLITYDEHGGTFDHVPPPRTRRPVPLGRRRWRLELSRRLVALFVENRNAPFDFRRLGVRVPAVVISPWIDEGRVDDTLYDHTSVIATVRKLFELGDRGLTRRDRWANSLHHLVLARSSPRTPVRLPPRGPSGPSTTETVRTKVAEAIARAPGRRAGESESRGEPVTPRDSLIDQLNALAPKIESRLDEMGAPRHVTRRIQALETEEPSEAAGSRFMELARQRRRETP